MVPVLVVAFLTSGGWGFDALAQEPTICVVGNVPESTGAVDVDLVRRLFLERQRFWPDGPPAHPVNLPASSSLREDFSRLVFGQSVKDMAPYWNERYFHGTRPPPTVASEEAVLLFVARTEGGLGYVTQPLTDDLPAGVRLLTCLPATPPR